MNIWINGNTPTPNPTSTLYTKPSLRRFVSWILIFHRNTNTQNVNVDRYHFNQKCPWFDAFETLRWSSRISTFATIIIIRNRLNRTIYSIWYHGLLRQHNMNHTQSLSVTIYNKYVLRYISVEINIFLFVEYSWSSKIIERSQQKYDEPPQLPTYTYLSYYCIPD